jgi:hypothetical protein
MFFQVKNADVLDGVVLDAIQKLGQELWFIADNSCNDTDIVEVKLNITSNSLKFVTCVNREKANFDTNEEYGLCRAAIQATFEFEKIRQELLKNDNTKNIDHRFFSIVWGMTDRGDPSQKDLKISHPVLKGTGRCAADLMKKIVAAVNGGFISDPAKFNSGAPYRVRVEKKLFGKDDPVVFAFGLLELPDLMCNNVRELTTLAGMKYFNNEPSNPNLTQDVPLSFTELMNAADSDNEVRDAPDSDNEVRDAPDSDNEVRQVHDEFLQGSPIQQSPPSSFVMSVALGDDCDMDEDDAFSALTAEPST